MIIRKYLQTRSARQKVAKFGTVIILQIYFRHPNVFFSLFLGFFFEFSTQNSVQNFNYLHPSKPGGQLDVTKNRNVLFHLFSRWRLVPLDFMDPLPVPIPIQLWGPGQPHQIPHLHRSRSNARRSRVPRATPWRGPVHGWTMPTGGGCEPRQRRSCRPLQRVARDKEVDQVWGRLSVARDQPRRVNVSLQG